MELLTGLLCAAALKCHWGYTTIISCLTAIPPHILLLSNMDTVLTKYISLSEQVDDDLNAELDERNIIGGYNTKILMEYFQGEHY